MFSSFFKHRFHLLRCLYERIIVYLIECLPILVNYQNLKLEMDGFLSKEKLGINQWEREELILFVKKVDNNSINASNFSMIYKDDIHLCIGRHIFISRFPEKTMVECGAYVHARVGEFGPITELFSPSEISRWHKITPQEARDAVVYFLETGDPQWGNAAPSLVRPF
ncbi:hypothetical protein [Beijerinckia mobilis]|uniref:hypothetical protein n=1 Tax=Beijerinckia mobilis TaxID=231434 RepID=UPI000552B2B1|nr:hypothetical protein [Beijerinckia mobilis]